MNIALLTPSYNLMKKGYGSKIKIRGGLYPPLGLAYLASPLINDGHKVKIIDASSYEYTNKKIGDILLEFKPDLIGISSVTASAEESYSLANYLKSKFGQVPLVYGGHHANCFPEMVFSNIKDLDLLFCGEAELTFREAVIFYEKKRAAAARFTKYVG